MSVEYSTTSDKSPWRAKPRNTSTNHSDTPYKNLFPGHRALRLLIEDMVLLMDVGPSVESIPSTSFYHVSAVMICVRREKRKSLSRTTHQIGRSVIHPSTQPIPAIRRRSTTKHPSANRFSRPICFTCFSHTLAFLVACSNDTTGRRYKFIASGVSSLSFWIFLILPYECFFFFKFSVMNEDWNVWINC